MYVYLMEILCRKISWNEEFDFLFIRYKESYKGKVLVEEYKFSVILNELIIEIYCIA